MAKRCETFDHTADVGLAARADTLAELYEALAEGLAETICPRARARPRQSVEIAVEAEDREALAVDFLSEVLNAIQLDRFMVHECRAAGADETHVRAELIGEPFDPARHEISTEVKAVTYHGLSVAREGDSWIGTLILDL